MARETHAGWHPETIKSHLRAKYGPITTLAISWGFSKNGISGALRRPDYSQRIELLIADALGEPPHVLWPARWAPDGTALPRSVVFDPIAGAPVRNSQIRKAA